MTVPRFASGTGVEGAGHWYVLPSLSFIKIVHRFLRQSGGSALLSVVKLGFYSF